MAFTNYQIALIAGGFTIVGGLLGSFITHRLTLSRDRQRSLAEINKALLNEIKAIETEMSTMNGPIDRGAWHGHLIRCKLSSVNFTAFKRTCTQKQQKELDAAYNDYKTTAERYKSFSHFKTLIENIINDRAG